MLKPCVAFVDHPLQIGPVIGLSRRLGDSCHVYCLSPDVSLRLAKANVAHRKIWEVVPDQILGPRRCQSERLANIFVRDCGVNENFNRAVWLRIFVFIQYYFKLDLSIGSILDRYRDASVVVFPAANTPHLPMIAQHHRLNQVSSILQQLVLRLATRSGLQIVKRGQWLRAVFWGIKANSHFRMTVSRLRSRVGKPTIPIDSIAAHVPECDLVLFECQAEHGFGQTQDVLDNLDDRYRVLRLNAFTPRMPEPRSISMDAVTLKRTVRKSIQRTAKQLKDRYLARLPELDDFFCILTRDFSFQLNHWFETLLLEYLARREKLHSILDAAQPKVAISGLNYVGPTEEFNLICRDRGIHVIGLNHGCHSWWPAEFPDVDEVMSWGTDDTRLLKKAIPAQVIGNPSWVETFRNAQDGRGHRKVVLLSALTEIDYYPSYIRFVELERTLEALQKFLPQMNLTLVIKSHPRLDHHQYYDAVADVSGGTVLHVAGERELAEVLTDAFCVIGATSVSTSLYEAMIYKRPFLYLSYLNSTDWQLPIRFGITVPDIGSLEREIRRLLEDAEYFDRALKSQKNFLVANGYLRPNERSLPARLDELISPGCSAQNQVIRRDKSGDLF